MYAFLLLLGAETIARLAARLDTVVANGPLPTATPGPLRNPESDPPHEPEPVHSLDSRLIGSWHHTTYYSEDDFSFASSTSRLFGSDGRYVEGSQSFVNSVHRSSGGGTIGHSATAGAPTHLRGQWWVDGDKLILTADDGQRYAYQMQVYPDSLLLTPHGRDPILWER